MGNGGSKTQAYHAYLERQQRGAAGDAALDPYEVMGVAPNFSWDDLKEAYRQRAKLVHPDRPGGNELLFKAVTDCFRQLAVEFKARESGKPHAELRAESRAHAEQQAETVSALAEELRGEKFTESFNRLFAQNKPEDEEADFGYGAMMAASTGKSREDIAIPRLVAHASGDKFARDFNSTFERVTLSDKKEVVRYAEPEALPMARQLQFTEIGGARPSEYTRTAMDGAKSIAYTDYKRAFEDTRLVDPRAVAQRKEYRTVDEYASARAQRTEAPATAEELEYRKAKEAAEAQQEAERLRRAKERDSRDERHYQKVSQLFLRR